MYEWKGKVAYYRFDSMSDFLSHLEDAKVNAKVFRSLSSQQTGRKEFTGTNTYEEAVEIAQKGWKDGLNKVKDHLRSIKPMGMAIKKQRNVNDLVGGAVLVPRYLSGEHDNMLNIVRRNSHERVIDLYASFNANAGYTTERIIKRGAFVCQLVDDLESSGIRTNIWACEAAEEGSEKTHTRVCIKQARDIFTINRFAFALAHPAFLRRLWFRMLETTPDFKARWDGGYGHPMDSFFWESMAELARKSKDHFLFVPGMADLPSLDKLTYQEFIAKTAEFNKKHGGMSLEGFVAN